ncbi:hypothetical protein, partial [Dermacoccus nishinomiyaensis]|uniref:hypothetical protein n=1 Tax=Dermacoccus nishinomiyaensis TaxID=1274 RepID=UPI001C92C190
GVEYVEVVEAVEEVGGGRGDEGVGEDAGGEDVVEVGDEDWREGEGVDREVEEGSAWGVEMEGGEMEEEVGDGGVGGVVEGFGEVGVVEVGGEGVD